MEKIFEIWCRTTNDRNEKVMFWCKSIYQRWSEEDLAFRRRAKRTFNKYLKEHQKEGREFHLIERE